MAQLYWEQGWADLPAQFDHFFRSYPDYGTHQAGYCVTAGLDRLVEWMETARFGEDRPGSAPSARPPATGRRASATGSWRGSPSTETSPGSKSTPSPRGGWCTPMPRWRSCAAHWRWRRSWRPPCSTGSTTRPWWRPRRPGSRRPLEAGRSSSSGCGEDPRPASTPADGVPCVGGADFTSNVATLRRGRARPEGNPRPLHGPGVHGAGPGRARGLPPLRPSLSRRVHVAGGHHRRPRLRCSQRHHRVHRVGDRRPPARRHPHRLGRPGPSHRAVRRPPRTGRSGRRAHRSVVGPRRSS